MPDNSIKIALDRPQNYEKNGNMKKSKMSSDSFTHRVTHNKRIKWLKIV